VLTENLRRLIGMHVLRQEDLAQEVGLSKQAIFNIVSGRSVPGSQTAIKLAAAFGIGLDDLFADDPRVCLRAAVDALEDAPVRRIGPIWVMRLQSNVERQAREEEERPGRGRDGSPERNTISPNNSERLSDQPAGSQSHARGQTKRT
jgi:DNA-binding XRE family transcriptional regulator